MLKVDTSKLFAQLKNEIEGTTLHVGVFDKDARKEAKYVKRRSENITHYGSLPVAKKGKASTTTNSELVKKFEKAYKILSLPFTSGKSEVVAQLVYFILDKKNENKINNLLKTAVVKPILDKKTLAEHARTKRFNNTPLVWSGQMIKAIEGKIKWKK